MGFVYKERLTVEGPEIFKSVIPFTHTLVFESPTYSESAAHVMSWSEYRQVVFDLVSVIGPGITIWKEEVQFHHNENCQPSLDDCHWQVQALIPLTLGFRTMDHVLAAKTAIG